MPALSGKTGHIYTNSLVIEDCNDTWNEQVIGGVTLSTTTGKDGNAARATTVGVGVSILMSEAISVDLSAYKTILAWVRSGVNTSAGDLQLLLDDTANCASPLETLNLPALLANTWTRVLLKLSNPAALTAIISIGLKQAVDLADTTFDIDDVRALKSVAGMRQWTLNYKTGTEEVTDFDSAGKDEFLSTTTGWSGNFDGMKKDVPLTIGQQVWLSLAESDTAGQAWNGQAIIADVEPAVDTKGLVLYKYNFIGTGELQVALL